MPRIAIDYSNVIFYQIACKDLTVEERYIGHTTNFTNRKNQHKRSCNDSKYKDHTSYLYSYIRENGGWNNWEMVMIEICDCDNRLEALKKERDYIELFEASLNSAKPTTRTTETQEDIDIAYQNAVKQVKKDRKEKKIKEHKYLNEVKQMIK